MRRLSSLLVVVGLASWPVAAGAQRLTCDASVLDADSYRLTTVAQALNVTRPRTDWWDAFDVTLRPYEDALWDLNEAALTIAERARALDPRNQLALSQLARQRVIVGSEGRGAIPEIQDLFTAGGQLVWTATLYDVDARSFFLVGFGRDGIRVYRFGAAAPGFTRHMGVPDFPGPEAAALWRAWGGCVDGLHPEAFVPWSDVREIAAGNYVLWFRFATPVRVTSDRGNEKRLREFKVALHGAMGSVSYRVDRSGDWWEEPTVNGVGLGPSGYQERVRRTLAAVVDPTGRITLPKQKRGAGW